MQQLIGTRANIFYTKHLVDKTVYSPESKEPEKDNPAHEPTFVKVLEDIKQYEIILLTEEPKYHLNMEGTEIKQKRTLNDFRFTVSQQGLKDLIGHFTDLLDKTEQDFDSE